MQQKLLWSFSPASFWWKLWVIDWSAGIGSSNASHICQLECGLVCGYILHICGYTLHTMWIHTLRMHTLGIHSTHYLDSYHLCVCQLRCGHVWHPQCSGYILCEFMCGTLLMCLSAMVGTCMWTHTLRMHTMGIHSTHYVDSYHLCVCQLWWRHLCAMHTVHSRYELTLCLSLVSITCTLNEDILQLFKFNLKQTFYI